MTEFLDKVTFAVSDPLQAEALAEFEGRYGKDLNVEGVGSLLLDVAGEQVEGTLRVERRPDGLQVVAEIQDINPEWDRRLAPLRTATVAKWFKELAKLPAGAAEASLDVTYRKPTDEASGAYVAYSMDGLLAVRNALRRRFVADAPPAIVIKTALVQQLHAGRGIAVLPLDASPGEVPSGPLLVPDIPGLEDVLAKLQTDYLGLRLLGHDFGPAPAFNLQTACAASAWLDSHELRSTLGRRHLAARKHAPETDEDLRTYLKELRLLESELVGESLATFERATATFREISVELLRDIHGMQGEILAIVGSELFQTALAIAAVVTGLTLSDVATTSQALGVSMAVAALFLGGAFLKTATQTVAFRNLVDFNRHFERLPVAAAMPEFQAWYTTTTRRAIRSFNAAVAIGLPMAAIPLLGVTSLWLDASLGGPPLAWILFGLLTAAAFLGGGIFWVRADRMDAAEPARSP